MYIILKHIGLKTFDNLRIHLLSKYYTTRDPDYKVSKESIFNTKYCAKHAFLRHHVVAFAFLEHHSNFKSRSFVSIGFKVIDF